MSKQYALLAIAVAIGFSLRIYHLSSNPPALNQDYASVGYNAFALLKTGADEYGQRFPLVFRSFDVYNLPLAIYLTVPSIALFGLTELGVRIPAVLFGTLTIVFTYLLVRQLTTDDTLASISAFLLAISPWHIQYSREASISVLFVLLTVCGAFLLLTARTKPTLLPLSLFTFALSYYTYHSALVSATFILFLILLTHGRPLFKTHWLMIGITLYLMSIIPLAGAIHRGTASDRFHSVSIFQPDVLLPVSIERMQYDLEQGSSFGALTHNRRFVYAQTILKNYLEHFRFNYLFFDGMANRMFRIPDMGLLYLWDLPFLLYGLYLTLNSFRQKQSQFLLGWFLIAPVPSALAFGAPSSLRAVLMLPITQIFIAIGLIDILKRLSVVRFGRFIRSCLLGALALNILVFTHQLFTHAPIEAAESWNYSVKQASLILKQRQDQYATIVFTYHYKQPYIYYLFYNKIDPHWFQANWYPGEVMRRSRALGNITYRDIVWEQDRLLPNALLIGAPDEFPSDVPGVIHTIRSLNGKPTLLLVETKANTPSATFGARRLTAPGT